MYKIPNNYKRIHNWAIFMTDTLNDQLPWRLTKAIVPCMGKFFTLKWNLLCRWGLTSQHTYCTLNFPEKMMKNFAYCCCKSSNQYHCIEESNFLSCLFWGWNYESATLGLMKCDCKWVSGALMKRFWKGKMITSKPVINNNNNNYYCYLKLNSILHSELHCLLKARLAY